MNKYNEEIINETRKSLEKDDEYSYATVIKGFDVLFGGSTIEDVSDEKIAFALDIVDAYIANKEKYDNAAVNEVKNYLTENADVDDSKILNQIGTPIVYVSTKLEASLLYDGVEEIGNHMPEVILNRDLGIVDVAING